MTQVTMEESLIPEPTARPQPKSWLRARSTRLILAVIVAVYASVTIMAMRQTSATFDEIIMPSAGARGYVTGDFDLIHYFHPRLPLYLYGLPVFLSRPSYPKEFAGLDKPDWAFPYARELYFDRGNHGPQLAFRARLVAVAFGVTLILLVFAFTRRYYGDVPALLAAGMTAFLPDLLAHGGISYNDVPGAAAFFAAVWSLERAVRNPTLRMVALASIVTGLALTVKYSAVALAPVILALIVVETFARGREWKRYIGRMTVMLPVAALIVYLTVVAVYLGDFTLESYRTGFDFNMKHASYGHGVPALLLGRESLSGFWYFFPVVFFMKTPAALHVLMIIALLGLATRRDDLRAFLRSPLRGPVIAGSIFLFFLMRSSLNIGFRHAMPLLPLVMVIIAVGLGRVWLARRRLRVVIGALVVVQATLILSWFPHFIPYQSEYFPQRDLGVTRLTDSNHDWGQGLPLLKKFMEEEGISTVYLSYFGSAKPEAYGIDYVSLKSNWPLAKRPLPAEMPQFTAISASNLVGTYVFDEFAWFRKVEPYKILGHTIFIYRADQ